ncbi:MAG: phospholipase D-like domain-containing protein [Chloroflexota bacterium]|nr:phospholipase D-like domain-containing protein [Chloroflexota bacterium]MDE2909837.1 phospholipase D-like domain-containing protein [Chloroflexota bacterium]
MPRIFDNISDKLLTALHDTMQSADRADFCVGYFNLRGWRLVQADIDQLSAGEEGCCRVLIGMNTTPGDELREYLSLRARKPVDQQQVLRRKRQIVEDFRRQLAFGAPSNEDERALRDLVRQLRAGKVAVKLFLRYPLHAKLYLIHRRDTVTPTVGYLGSSNLTLAGLSKQGELNTEVSDVDACQKLQAWFDERWDDRWCLDITEDLIEVINASWAREDMLTPYELYLKIAYHLAQEARAGLNQFKLPPEFDKLLDYQAAAVRIAARHLNTRDGVLLGDVVGLGKTLMATALAKIFQDDQSWDSLIICPPNLVRMWRKYVDDYRLMAKVVSLSMVTKELPDLRRYRIVIIDESHNLRNRDTQRYRAVHDYISANESRCILLSATPYNKSYLDLSAQLRLFISEDDVLGIRPEQYLKTVGEAQFQQQFQAHPRSIVAFEKSERADDWRDLMRLYLVRRTRSFIENHYAETESLSGRRFMELDSGERFYFPRRVPKTVPLAASPQYQRLYSDQVVELVNDLSLPRYGLGQYVDDREADKATAGEKRQIENLSRAGKRLMGFCRTNLFKRLESSGASFLLSVDRHITRNYVFLHAIENDLDLPIGSLDAHILDPDTQDEDSDSLFVALHLDDEGNADDVADANDLAENYVQRARAAYDLFSGRYKRRFKWLRASLFTDSLGRELQEDIDRLSAVIQLCGEWNVAEDTKLTALRELISADHAGEKLLVFSQFADTIRYLQDELTHLGIGELEAATGQHDNPTALAHRFSPVSNELRQKPANEIRVLLSTDVLSEGQNLQDSAIVINYDLPWAIIRLSQRAGRVDRIGQQAEEIRCYSFMPAQGVEEIIRLRSRVRQRLEENGEVVGSDEQFFEDDKHARQLRDLYTEKSGILDLEADSEVDLSSYAYQEWANATKDNPALRHKIEALRETDGVYSSRHYLGSAERPQGVITYVKSANDTDALVWLDQEERVVTESQLAILRAAKCDPDTPRQALHPGHHDLALKGARKTQEEDYIALTGGQLGRPNSTRRRAYEALKRRLDYLRLHEPLFLPEDLERALDDVYRHPLLDSARDRLNRQLRADISDEDLAELAVGLWRDDRLSRRQEGDAEQEPRILCSLGLFDAWA